VTEEARKGIYSFDDNQSRYPIKFMQKMIQQFKIPKKIDNGPDVPIERIKNVTND